MNKVLIGIPTAPFLNYGEYEAKWPDNEYDRANRRWERVYGRFNGPATERQTTVRETWWKHQAPATCKFFMGRTATEEHKADDVVLLDCGDNYLFDLQEKIQGMARWALDNDFDIMIKLDDDSFVYPALVPFLQQLEGVDYGGCIYNSYCVGGGTGEVYSRKALEIISTAPPTVFPEHRHWEDRWFGEILHAAGIQATYINGFTDEPNVSPPVRYTFHPLSPKGLRQAYKEVYLDALQGSR
jgi:hypothetical protein